MSKLDIYYKGQNLITFDEKDPIKELIAVLSTQSEGEIDELQFRVREEVKESIVEDVPDSEFTIMSASDFSDEGDQIPLVKIKKDENGELYAEAIGDDEFDTESFKIATASLKSTAGKSDKERLTRVDKSLNHSDPNLSTELARDFIVANRGNAKKSIKDIIGKDPSKVTDEPRTEDEIKALDKETKYDEHGMQLLAGQVLMANRDDLKAKANLKTTTEDDLVKMFNEITGVDYYTEKIVDKDQYNYILDLLGRSTDIYKDSNVSPEDNKYVQGLKNLTEGLIEKVLVRNDPDFYKI